MLDKAKCDNCASKYSEWRKSLVRSNKCPICFNNDNAPEYAKCQVCLDKERARYDPITEKEYRKGITNKRINAGLCRKCTSPAAPGTVSCQRHTDKHVLWTAQRRIDRMNAGLCVKCGLHPRREYALSCQGCADIHRKHYIANSTILKEKSKINYHIRYHKLKKSAHEAYGNKCKCCQMTNSDMFTFDHVNNDGSTHRKILSSAGDSGESESFMKWLRDNNYPDTIQLLCANCHLMKTKGMICTH